MTVVVTVSPGPVYVYIQNDMHTALPCCYKDIDTTQPFAKYSPDTIVEQLSSMETAMLEVH